MEGLTPEKCLDLVNGFETVHKAQRERTTNAVAMLVARLVQDEHQQAAERVVEEHRRSPHSEKLKELLSKVPIEDPMMVLLARTVHCGGATGLATLAEHTSDHAELLSDLVWAVTACSTHCPGHEFVVTHVLRGTGDVTDVLNAAQALCFTVSDRNVRALETPEYTEFLTEAARTGFASRDVLATREASRHIGYGPQVPKDVLETYFRLVLDGTRPQNALRMAEALAA